jgi:hypothetical protein
MPQRLSIIVNKVLPNEISRPRRQDHFVIAGRICESTGRLAWFLLSFDLMSAMGRAVGGAAPFQFAMQLRLFRHFVPVSVVLLVSSDALLITGAFYQLLSHSEIGTPIVLGLSSFSAQFAGGLAAATVTAMVSVGLYGQQSFVDFRLLLSKIVVASILVLMLVSFSVTYWRDGLAQLTDFSNFPIKATLIWLVCVAVTRGTFSVTLGRGLLKRRILVLGNGTQAARIAKLVETRQNEHFIPVSFIEVSGERVCSRSARAHNAAAGLDELVELAERLGAGEVVVAPTIDGVCRLTNCCTASSLASR